MKSILVSLFMVIAKTTFAHEAGENIHPKPQYTALEKAFIELFLPQAKARGFNAITINQDFDNTKYVGGVTAVNGEIRIVFGSEFSEVYPDLAEDAYAEILCHELGHILGGTSPDEQDPGVEISPEAASDYFAGAVCLPKLFKNFPAKNPVIADPVVIANCQLQFSDTEEQKICQRVASAGLSFFTSFRESLIRLVPTIKYDKFYAVPDLRIKDQGFYGFYPTFQCRSETVAAGAYCKTSQNLWENGHRNWHCLEGLGARPSCWYKAN